MFSLPGYGIRVGLPYDPDSLPLQSGLTVDIIGHFCSKVTKETDGMKLSSKEVTDECKGVVLNLSSNPEVVK